VEDIVQGAFWGCKNLRSVTVPASVRHIGPYIFHSCINLENVEVQWQTPVRVSNIFQGIDLDFVTLTVPSDSKTAYKYADGWRNFGTIKEKN
jgi:hexosaminidase